MPLFRVESSSRSLPLAPQLLTAVSPSLSVPTITWAGLPDVPKGIVHASDKYFHSAIGVIVNGKKISHSSTKSRPAAPPVVRSSLPDMPQSVVRSAGKYFQSAISIVGHGQHIIYRTAARCPATPAIVRRRLPDVP